MPLRTEFYNFEEEIERIEEQMEEVAQKIAPLNRENPMYPELEQVGDILQSQRDGLLWAQEEWGVDGVTLGGLTGGEYGYIEDSMGEGGQGKARVYFVAKGTVDAPYISEEDGFEEQKAAVADLAIGYLRWADNRIHQLMGVSGNGHPRFDELLREARAKEQEEQTSEEPETEKSAES